MENKIQNLEDELKVLKNEVQAVLLDIKDFLIVGGGIGAATGAAISGSESSAAGEPAATQSATTDGADAPPLQQTPAVSQTPSPPESEAPTGSESIKEGGTEPAESGWCEDAAGQAALIFEDDSNSVVTDWSSEIPTSDRAATGPGEDAGFGEGDWGSGANNQFERVPGESGHAAEGDHDESASDLLTPDSSRISSQIEAEDEVDLTTLAILMPWISRAVNSAGKEHIIQLIELYDVSRDLPSRLKQAILMLLELHGDCSSPKLSGDSLIRETIPLLIELDSLLLRHRTGTLESAILSLLQDKMTKQTKARSRKVHNG